VSDTPVRRLLELIDGTDKDEGRQRELFLLLDAVLRPKAKSLLSGANAHLTLRTDDLLQEVAIKLIAAGAHPPKRSRSMAWLTAIMRNCFKDFLRRRRGKTRHPGGQRQSFEHVDPARVADPTPDPPAAVLGKDLFEWLDRTIAELAVEHPRQAAAIRLRIVDGLTYQEIADRLAVSVTQVYQDCRFATAYLRTRAG
jgi:RNA polymerase sigma factor (sigma-70 family)